MRGIIKQRGAASHIVRRIQELLMGQLERIFFMGYRMMKTSIWKQLECVSWKRILRDWNGRI